MKYMIDMVIGKMLDLANYLMTALLVAYFIDPSAGSQHRQTSFGAAMFGISLIYAISILIILALKARAVYNRRKRT